MMFKTLRPGSAPETGVSIVWNVRDTWEDVDLATFLTEASAIAFARARNPIGCPRLQVERSHLVGGGVY